MRTYQMSRLRGLAILAASALLTSQAWTQTAQTSVGRGARDPLRVDVIVGSEGKGMFASAGIPVDNMPIFASRDGAVPAGVQPLPTISSPRATSTRTATCGPTIGTTAATRPWVSSRSGARIKFR